MWWLWVILIVLLLLALAPFAAIHIMVLRKYVPLIVRVLQENPLLIFPRGQVQPDAEQVQIPTTHDLKLHGCYLHARQQRKGVILFGLEFGSNCWACVPYCEFLRDAGYDIFAFETRGQGESPSHPGYDPLVWVTDFEVDDYRAALSYLKNRPDADPRGVGFFGISKGGSAGLYVACEEPFVRCCVTDGIYATHTTMVPYMRKWILIYSKRVRVISLLPLWYYAYAAHIGLKLTSKTRHCAFPHLEWRIDKLAPRPLLMIHGEADNYIKPEMTQTLFAKAGEPKELWIVPGAKHNQAFNLAGDEYKERILKFFDKHLAAAALVGLASVAGCQANGSVNGKDVPAILAEKSPTLSQH